MGDQFGTLVETVVSIGVAVLISFVVNWLLTLVIVVFVPIMVGAGLLQLLVLALHASHYKKSTEEALKVCVNCCRYRITEILVLAVGFQIAIAKYHIVGKFCEH